MGWYAGSMVSVMSWFSGYVKFLVLASQASSFARKGSRILMISLRKFDLAIEPMP